MTRVVVLGDLVTDVVVRLAQDIAIGSDAAASITTSGGGSGANVAAWLASIGGDVVFIGCVGDDAAGDARARELQCLGVDTRLIVRAGAVTGTVIVLVTPDGQRTMLPDRGANTALLPEDLPGDVFAPGNHLHISGYSLFTDPPRAAALRALELARDATMTISVDPSSAAPLRDIGAAGFVDWTAGADLCVPNLAEAQILTGAADAARAALALSRHYRLAVVTAGGDGAVLAEGERLTAQAAAVATVVDTTGAGDAFTAGFLRSLLAGDAGQTALEAAAAVAARAVAVRGARPALRG